MLICLEEIQRTSVLEKSRPFKLSAYQVRAISFSGAPRPPNLNFKISLCLLYAIKKMAFCAPVRYTAQSIAARQHHLQWSHGLQSLYWQQPRRRSKLHDNSADGIVIRYGRRRYENSPSSRTSVVERWDQSSRRQRPLSRWRDDLLAALILPAWQTSPQ